ncbi:hypothetical protein V1512DRAFT_268581 [Lipomyces arxii]|uniref:uncharacterized protein n=1 Tax=Lipomyces arxii TaxID=56418 RepID=UPI0034CFE970
MFSDYASKFLSNAQGRQTESRTFSPSSSSVSVSSQSPQSQQSSRLFFSAADLPENDDNPRSLYSPRRIWLNTSILPKRNRGRFVAADEVDEEGDDAVGSLSRHNIQGETSQTSRIFFSKRSRLFFKTPPANGSTILGASSIARDGGDMDGPDGDDHMAGTYTGHLYAAESVIRSSWREQDDEDEDEGKMHTHTQCTRSVHRSASDEPDASEVLSSRNSMESVGLESVMSKRQQSPPPARLRFNEHTFPRNMVAATTTAATARHRVVLDEEEEDLRKSSYEYDDSPCEDVAIEMPPILSGDRPDKRFDDMLILPVSESFHIPQTSNRRPPDENERLVLEGFIPPKLTDRIELSGKDRIWSRLYMMSMCCLFATSLLVWLETDVTASISLTDSIYTVVEGSMSTLGLETLFAILISAVWFLLLRICVRPALYVLVVSIPFALCGLTIYPLIMSYRDNWGGNTAQDKAMRWTSMIPAVSAVVWVWIVARSRNVLGRAVGIVQLACKILSENPSLIVLSLGTLVSFVTFTWVWFGMFARVFLKGTVVVGKTGIATWILDRNSWVLGAWYILMYLWSWGVFSGVQRMATSITVSQWYFHRDELPQVPSMEILSAALQQTGTVFPGTVCFSSFIALLIRMPLLLLPRRVIALVQMLMFNVIPGPLSTLTNPLTLCYAGMTIQSLVPSSHGIANLRFVDLGPHGSFRSSWTAYRLAKMMLSSARAVTALALGFGAWVHAAQDVNGGSLYGYIVGMMGGAIGWVVLGATEGSLSMIVDASFIAFAIDQAGSHGGHCRKADAQFGGLE